jgi:hypothetical protein
MLESSIRFIIKDDGGNNTKNNLVRHVDARKWIVYSTASMSCGFSGDDDISKFNPLMWDKKVPKSNSHDAIRDIFNNPKEYAIGCCYGAEAVMLHGISTVMEEDDFNKALKGDPFHYSLTDLPDSILKRSDGISENSWIPRDWGFIRNSAPREMSKPSTRGENIIHVWGGLFFGHGPWREVHEKYRSLEAWKKEVFGWNGVEPMVESWRDYPSAGLAK